MPSLRTVVGLLWLIQIVVVGRLAAADSPQTPDARAKQFIDQYEATVRPLEIEVIA